MMNLKSWKDSVSRFLQEEDGPTAVEYAVMLALIVVTATFSAASLGSNVSDRFISTATDIGN